MAIISSLFESSIWLGMKRTEWQLHNPCSSFITSPFQMDPWFGATICAQLEAPYWLVMHFDEWLTKSMLNLRPPTCGESTLHVEGRWTRSLDPSICDVDQALIRFGADTPSSSLDSNEKKRRLFQAQRSMIAFTFEYMFVYHFPCPQNIANVTLSIKFSHAFWQPKGLELLFLKYCLKVFGFQSPFK